ncbi:MAG: hypothetical protein ACP5MG_06830, partial [Verrucomicrobiia bacterium]
PLRSSVPSVVKNKNHREHRETQRKNILFTSVRVILIFFNFSTHLIMSGCQCMTPSGSVQPITK